MTAPRMPCPACGRLPRVPDPRTYAYRAAYQAMPQRASRNGLRVVEYLALVHRGVIVNVPPWDVAEAARRAPKVVETAPGAQVKQRPSSQPPAPSTQNSP